MCLCVFFSSHLKGCTRTTKANRDAATVFHVSIQLPLLPIHFIIVVVETVGTRKLAANFDPMCQAQKPNIRYGHCDNLNVLCVCVWYVLCECFIKGSLI